MLRAVSLSSGIQLLFLLFYSKVFIQQKEKSIDLFTIYVPDTSMYSTYLVSFNLHYSPAIKYCFPILQTRN